METDNNTSTKPVLIAAAWPYANGDLHLGHPSGYLLPAGILNDFLRMQGRDVIMVSGSDMHGTPIAVKAWQKGVSPEEFSLAQHKKNLALMKTLGMNYSLYTSTATEIHQQVVQQLFILLEKHDFITKDKTDQFWSEKEHKFLLDRYIEGECPHCHYSKARGDQCDNCGRTLIPEELLNPYSIFGDERLAKRTSTNYYLRLDKLQPLLEEHYQNHPNFKNWRKHVASTTKAWLTEGLTARAITRDMEGFGVKLPVGHEIPGEAGKVIYVWFEAVSGYLTAVVELALREQPEQAVEISKLFSLAEARVELQTEVLQTRIPGQSFSFADYWLDPEVKAFYFMGKDNIPFHSIIWTAMLLGLNLALKAEGKGEFQLTLPWEIPANQFMNLQGAKFSKSLGNIIDSKEFVAEFGLDAARYYLISRMPENKDYDFTWQEFVEANNGELVANFGNLVNRTLVFWNKNYANLPVAERAEIAGLPVDTKLRKETTAMYEQVAELLWSCRFSQGLQRIIEYSSFGNKFFADSEIWKQVKTDFTGSKQVIRELLYLVANLANALLPFLPEFSANTLRYLGLVEQKLAVGKNNWQELELDFSQLAEIKDLVPLIKKLDLETVLAAKLPETAETTETTETDPK